MLRKMKVGGEGTTEDETVGWHHQLNGHESEQALGDDEGQGSQVCCSLWGCKESDMTERLNNDACYKPGIVLRSLQVLTSHLSCEKRTLTNSILKMQKLRL